MPKPDNLQKATERILEDESLTADLIDDAAKLLLDWGLAQAKMLIQQAERLSAEELGSCITDLRRTLKRIGKQAGKATPETQPEMVRALLSEIRFEEEEPEVDAWFTSQEEQPPLSRP
jgi:hypothetical protein